VANPELSGYGFETLTRALRTRTWEAAGDRNPARSATAADPLIIVLDATLVTSHSEKESVAGTYKGGYGFAPFIASVDYGAGNGSGEILAAVLRPGNAGANSAEDHIRVFHTAVAQLPDGFYNETGGPGRGEGPGPHRQCRGLTEVSLAPAQPRRAVLHQLRPAVRQGTNDRLDHRQTLLAASLGPGRKRPDRCMGHQRHRHHSALPITRRARTCSSAPSRCTLLGTDGHRITAFLTNSPRWHGPFLDARHRARARCENRIKSLKNTGLGKLPFFDFAANQAWANIAALAFNVVSWLQLAALPGGHHAKAWDIKRWRYRLFATAGKIITRTRRNQLLLSESAPEKDLLKLLLENTRPAQQRARSFHRLIVDLILSQRTASGANPDEPTGHTGLPENRKQPPISRGHKSAAIPDRHEKSRLVRIVQVRLSCNRTANSLDHMVGLNTYP
jgi:hypothetical protein